MEVNQVPLFLRMVQLYICIHTLKDIALTMVLYGVNLNILNAEELKWQTVAMNII